jgi:hypothetical protein
MLPPARSDSFIEGSLQTFNAASAAFFFVRFLPGYRVLACIFCIRLHSPAFVEPLREQSRLLLDTVEHRIAFVDQCPTFVAQSLR